MHHLPAGVRQEGRAAPETGVLQAATEPADGPIDPAVLEDLIDAAGGQR